MAGNSTDPHKLEETLITKNLEISPGVHLISFPRQYPFSPGQVVKIGLGDKNPPRIYSICSGNQEEEINILFIVKHDGLLTPKLAASIPGDRIKVSKPYGSFKSSTKPAVWIAAGTGIAPFYSMFRSGLSGNKLLIHGARHLNQFYFEDELERVMGKRYIRCCSSEKSCDTFNGRVTDYLLQLKNLDITVEYLICGKAIMVVETRDLLISKGIPFNIIAAEIYF